MDFGKQSETSGIERSKRKKKRRRNRKRKKGVLEIERRSGRGEQSRVEEADVGSAASRLTRVQRRPAASLIRLPLPGPLLQVVVVIVGAISRLSLAAVAAASSINRGRADESIAGTESIQLVASASEQVAAGDNGLLPSASSIGPDLLPAIGLLNGPNSSYSNFNSGQANQSEQASKSTSSLLSDNKSHLLLLFVLLVLINLIVILGNILVIVAFYATAKLRSVTNIFIVSLATADLLLGLLVLPYALMFEVSSLN